MKHAEQFVSNLSQGSLLQQIPKDKYSTIGDIIKCDNGTWKKN